ncbi:chromosome segregation protein SMC [Pseudanabaena sp. SR411]|uniref:AAA family ATPase n=1 Tax=Pseudanabaena sp. SR411 TaxID=1980935 RepID=UPI000B982500|nr:AAA family ATPase [Pseudanabaena sp. SR411]OYQ63573.1 chromosome segregation protein SMC [Pseudanabaena sp. SR411]
MLKSLKIENFRCFPFFEMQQLGRLNLIVGTNNSGKTSILEALQLLLNTPFSFDFEILEQITTGRSEYVISDEDQDRNLVVRHLFYNHHIDIDSKFTISGKSFGDNQAELIVSIKNIKTHTDLVDQESLFLCVKRLISSMEVETPFKLSSAGMLSLKILRSATNNLNHSKSNIQFVNSSSLTAEKALDLFEDIVLTSEEELVIQALQIIEPQIKRIAPLIGKNGYKGTRGSFIVQTPENQRIPIGSMGDGMWRILGLALAIVNAKNGVLLVDEIDTGLHFTVMSDMWKMLWETAKRLNVQIFATTHSNDCWQSLADIANAENPSEDGITIHRIEKDKSKSIVFTERQIAIAAERNIEVR